MSSTSSKMVVEGMGGGAPTGSPERSSEERVLGAEANVVLVFVVVVLVVSVTEAEPPGEPGSSSTASFCNCSCIICSLDNCTTSPEVGRSQMVCWVATL